MKAVTEEQLLGYGLLNFAYGVLESVRRRGILHTCSYYVASYIQAAMAYAWKAYKFTRWRVSRRCTGKEYAACDKACAGCPRQIVTQDGRYEHRHSRYCAECGCGQTKWAELTVKNKRTGHLCPLNRFPAQVERLKRLAAAEKKKGDCPTCGGGKTTKPETVAGRNGRSRPLEAWHRKSGLLALTGDTSDG